MNNQALNEVNAENSILWSPLWRFSTEVHDEVRLHFYSYAEPEVRRILARAERSTSGLGTEFQCRDLLNHIRVNRPALEARVLRKAA